MFILYALLVAVSVICLGSALMIGLPMLANHLFYGLPPTWDDMTAVAMLLVFGLLFSALSALLSKHDKDPYAYKSPKVIVWLALLAAVATSACVHGPTAPADADWCTIITVDPVNHTSDITHGPCPMWPNTVIRK